MSKAFDFADWYWLLDGDTTKVFSTKMGDYVALTDPDYLAFKAGENQTAVSTTDAIAASLVQLGLRPVHAAVLDSYKDAQAGDVIAKAAFKIIFHHENRLRAIERQLGLNGSPPNITAAQARAAVKALM